jgi:hypothetical protein
MATLVLRRPALGNLAVHDFRASVNVRALTPDFNRLTIDPYVRDGYRRKHLVRYRCVQQRSPTAPLLMAVLPLAPLLQPSDINPVHGGLVRRYPEFRPTPGPAAVAVHRLLAAYADIGGVVEGDTVLVQAQRVTCSPTQAGLPTVEGWHRDGVLTMGIVCVARYNVRGGLNEFRLPQDRPDRPDRPDRIERFELIPGCMAVFDDAGVEHRVTPVASEDGTTPGHRDVLLFSRLGGGAPLAPPP